MKMTIHVTLAGLIWLAVCGVMATPAISMAQSSKQPTPSAQQSSGGEKGLPSPAGESDAATVKVSSSADQTPITPPKKGLVPDPNRRWIMKQRDHSGKKILAKPPKSLKWRNKAQKSSCRAKTQPMANTFDRARFYSIQGDRCKTAHYAQAFLEAAGQCQKECPEGFLERNGYTEQILRNMHQLKALGTESCFGKNRPAAVKKTANQHKPSPSTK